MLLEGTQIVEPSTVTQENLAASYPQQELQINIADMDFINFNSQQDEPKFIQPSLISPSTSTSSKSKLLSEITKCRSKKSPRLNSVDDEYCGAINLLAESMRQPITINTEGNTGNKTSSLDPVDDCVTFLGSLLKTFQDEELKLEVMNNLTQIVIKAKSKDLKMLKINL